MQCYNKCCIYSYLSVFFPLWREKYKVTKLSHLINPEKHFTPCYGLNIWAIKSCLLKHLTLMVRTGNETLGMWLTHKDGALHNGVSACIQRGSIELLCSFHHVRTQQDGVSYELQSSPHNIMNLLISCSWIS